jgi:hypothetical protein
VVLTQLQAIVIPETPFLTSKPMWVRLEVTNMSNEPVEFCQLHTPFEGYLTNDYFQILDAGGKRVEYSGELRKRIRSCSSSWGFVLVRPGQTATSRVDLSKGYALSPGHYTLKFRGSKVNNNLPDSPVIEVSVK